jgi:6-phosphogluconolactonase (cycloisomerase 2 family)
VGCGSGSTTTAPPAKPDFLYAITLSGQPPNITFNLSSFKLDDSTGLLSWTETIALPQPTLGLAVDPGARFLYVSSPNLLLPSIDTYSINASTGVPTHANTFLLTAVCAFCPLQSAPGALCA